MLKGRISINFMEFLFWSCGIIVISTIISVVWTGVYSIVGVNNRALAQIIPSIGVAFIGLVVRDLWRNRHDLSDSSISSESSSSSISIPVESESDIHDGNEEESSSEISIPAESSEIDVSLSQVDDAVAELEVENEIIEEERESLSSTSSTSSTSSESSEFDSDSSDSDSDFSRGSGPSRSRNRMDDFSIGSETNIFTEPEQMLNEKKIAERSRINRNVSVERINLLLDSEEEPEDNDDERLQKGLKKYRDK